MKIATTIEDFGRYIKDDAEKVRAYEGTGFRHFDYSFTWIRGNKPNVGDEWFEIVKSAGREAEKLGFDFVQAHAPDYDFFHTTPENHEACIKILGNVIESCDYLGIKNLVVHTAATPDLRYPDDREEYFLKNKKFYEELIPFAEKYNVNILAENSAEQNAVGKYFFLTAQETRDFAEYVNHPLVHTVWDFGHANMRGTNPYDDIITLGDELKAIHLHDNFNDADRHFAPFMGTLDLDAVMQGLLDINYNGYLTFESPNLILADNTWPSERFDFPTPREKKLRSPSIELKIQSASLLYQIGKYMLTQYDCYEE